MKTSGFKEHRTNDNVPHTEMTEVIRPHVKEERRGYHQEDELFITINGYAQHNCSFCRHYVVIYWKT